MPGALVRTVADRGFGGMRERFRRGGGFQLRTLDEILRIMQKNPTLNEDLALYFRVVFTDQRGWNVRNEVCHGLASYGLFSSIVADRLMHILLVLAQLRLKEA